MKRGGTFAIQLRGPSHPMQSLVSEPTVLSYPETLLALRTLALPNRGIRVRERKAVDCEGRAVRQAQMVGDSPSEQERVCLVEDRLPRESAVFARARARVSPLPNNFLSL
jgi:hypothetical protein